MVAWTCLQICSKQYCIQIPHTLINIFYGGGFVFSSHCTVQKAFFEHGKRGTSLTYSLLFLKTQSLSFWVNAQYTSQKQTKRADNRPRF